MRARKNKRLDLINVCFKLLVVYCKMINSRDCCITEIKTIGIFCDGRLGFCKFFIQVFCFCFGVRSSMLIGLNKLAVRIPIVRGFSLLPFKNLFRFCGIQTKTGIVPPVPLGEVFCWRMLTVMSCLLLESCSLMVSISVRLDFWQSFELLH